MFLSVERNVVDIGLCGATKQDPALDNTDGLSADFGQWRFNLRSSKIEPLVRRSVESRGNLTLVDDKVGEISRLLAAA